MEGKDTFKQLRTVINDYYVDDVMLQVPRNYGRYVNIDSERYDLLTDIIFLMLKTSYSGSATKIYLLNPFMNIKGIVHLYNTNNNKALTEQGVYTSIWRDKVKFIKDFGESIIVKLVYDRELDISVYKEKVAELLNEYSQSNLLNEISLNLENDKNIYNEELSDEEFNRFIELIRPYTKRNIKRVENSINESMIGYIHYILNHQSITDIDKDRINILLKEINGD